MPHQDRPNQAVELLRMLTEPTLLREAAIAAAPFGPGFTSLMAQQADRLEVWGTTEDAPEDYTEFRLLKNCRVIGVARIPGY